MTRAAWTEIALTLADLRARLITQAKKARNENRPIHLARLQGLELAALAICKTLRGRSGRFDSHRFMRIVGGQTK